MPIFNAGNGQMTAQGIINSVQSKLANLQNALQAAADTYGWLSAYAVADLEAVGLGAADAQDLLTAAADANALAQINLTGLPPGSYPQPPSDYVYAASQRLIIGPG